MPEVKLGQAVELRGMPGTGGVPDAANMVYA